MKAFLTLALVASLAACGGGGGGGGGGSFAPVAAAPAPAPETAPAPTPGPAAPAVVSQNCVQATDRPHTNCDLVPGEVPTGAVIPSGSFASFTNRTGVPLQIDQVSAFTGERQDWSEYCVYLEHINTYQWPAGKGEVGCATKQIGEDYAPIRWGDTSGLSVAPNETVILNAHTEPAPVGHTYVLYVSVQASGVQSWRQPQVDDVIPCNGEEQSTVLSAWPNTTGRELHLTGASIYSENPSAKAPNTTAGAACIYVLTEDGTQKYKNCDAAIRTRGEVSFPLVTVAPGELVAAQAVNVCQPGNHWDWVAFLRVW